MTDRTTDRRSALKLIGAGALAMPAIWRPSPARAQSKVVNVTTYDKFLPQAFVDKFQRDTGLEVRVRLTDDQGKQYNLLAAEGGNPTTDIVTVAGHRLSQFIASSLIDPLDTGRVALGLVLASLAGPAPVAVHDDRDVARQVLVGDVERVGRLGRVARGCDGPVIDVRVEVCASH